MTLREELAVEGCALEPFRPARPRHVVCTLCALDAAEHIAEPCAQLKQERTSE